LIDSTDYGEGSDGTWRGNSTESNGYWFFNDDDTAGYWVSEDGQVTGDWTYDDETTSTGTWWFEGDSSWIGTWATDESNDTIKYDSTDYGDYEDYTCTDLDDGTVTNSAGETCAWYYQDGYEAECPYLNTDTFNAYVLCCACGGGLRDATDDSDDYAALGEACGYYSDSIGDYVECYDGFYCQTSDESLDGSYVGTCVTEFEAPTDYDGIGVDSDSNTLGYWYLNEDQSESSGHYVTSDGQYTGVWNYDEDYTLSGTWT
jgi:hypothetical protein